MEPWILWNSSLHFRRPVAEKSGRDADALGQSTAEMVAAPTCIRANVHLPSRRGNDPLALRLGLVITVLLLLRRM
jgi:hypothetical protein